MTFEPYLLLTLFTLLVIGIESLIIWHMTKPKHQPKHPPWQLVAFLHYQHPLSFFQRMLIISFLTTMGLISIIVIDQNLINIIYPILVVNLTTMGISGVAWYSLTLHC